MISIVPEPFPAEFRRDVIAVARKEEASVAQVPRDFGISESCLQRWLTIADREYGLAPAAAGDRGGGGKDSDAELRDGEPS
jgi:transposase